jgi:hypothetical protein
MKYGTWILLTSLGLMSFCFLLSPVGGGEWRPSGEAGLFCSRAASPLVEADWRRFLEARPLGPAEKCSALITGKTGWITGKRLWLLGKRLWLLGKRLWLLGKRLWLLGKSLWLLGKRLWLLGKRLELLENGLNYWENGFDYWENDFDFNEKAALITGNSFDYWENGLNN